MCVAGDARAFLHPNQRAQTIGRYADLIRILHVAYIRMLKDYICARGLVRIRHKRYIHMYIFTCLARSGMRAEKILLRKRTVGFFLS